MATDYKMQMPGGDRPPKRTPPDKREGPGMPPGDRPGRRDDDRRERMPPGDRPGQQPPRPVDPHRPPRRG